MIRDEGTLYAAAGGRYFGFNSAIWSYLSGGTTPVIPFAPDVEVNFTINRTVAAACSIQRSPEFGLNINRTVTDDENLTGR